MKQLIYITTFVFSFFLVTTIFYYYQEISWTTKEAVKIFVGSVVGGLILSFFRITKEQATNKIIFIQALILSIFIAVILHVI